MQYWKAGNRAWGVHRERGEGEREREREGEREREHKEVARPVAYNFIVT